jgi:hypothetical protein
MYMKTRSLALAPSRTTRNAAQEAAPAPPPSEPRKRAKSVATPKPAPHTIAIDFASPKARKALLALYPRVLRDDVRDASDAEQAAGTAYLAARDALATLEGAKESAGNVLCFGIGAGLGIDGDGWRATWGERAGSVDWPAVVALVAPGVTKAELDAAIEASRGERGRTLLVTAKGAA